MQRAAVAATVGRNVVPISPAAGLDRLSSPPTDTDATVAAVLGEAQRPQQVPSYQVLHAARTEMRILPRPTKRSQVWVRRRHAGQKGGLHVCPADKVADLARGEQFAP